MILPPPPSDPGQQAHDDPQDRSRLRDGETQDSSAATAHDPADASTPSESTGDSSVAEPYSSHDDPYSAPGTAYSAQAEQSSYPEAGSPYAPPGAAASAHGHSSDQNQYGPPRYSQPGGDQTQYGQTGYGQTDYGPAHYGQQPYGQGDYPRPAGQPVPGPVGYSQLGYGQMANGQPADGAARAPAPLSDQNERNLALAAHLGALGGAVFSGGSLGWLVPLVIYLMYKDRSAYIRTHAAAALNFQIAVIIAVIASFVLMLVLIGFLTIIGVGLAALIFPIIAAVAASDGRPYRYPLTPTMVK